MADQLKQIRQQIDALDKRLLKLLSSRARLAQRIGRLKQGPAYRPEREAQVVRGILAENRGPLPDAAVARLYTEIMSACRALEDSLTVAYLGPQGTFSQEAAVKHFGGLAVLASGASIDEVFRQVETGAAGYGVVPVENSTEGAIGRTLDLLLSTPAKVCGEIMLPIRQCLMSRSGTLTGIHKVYSHTQSLAQCQQWLARHLPHAARVAVVSNAEAARLAARERCALGPRQDFARPVGAQRPGRGARAADAAGGQPGEHDAARIPSRAHRAVGIRLLRRYRRPPAGRQRGARAGGARAEGILFQEPRLLPRRGCLNK
jgi:chorismate mutase/prephenate dehydratase